MKIWPFDMAAERSHGHVFRRHGAHRRQAAVDIAQPLDVVQVLLARQQRAGADVRVGRRALRVFGGQPRQQRSITQAARGAARRGR
jgi:hypothetical protein